MISVLFGSDPSCSASFTEPLAVRAAVVVTAWANEREREREKCRPICHHRRIVTVYRQMKNMKFPFP